MEQLVEQPAHEELKSFNLLASVDMFRFDVQRHGQILPETRERVYDEEISYVTEAVDRAARTSFSLSRQNGELVYFNKGEWQPYMATLTTGLEVARSEAVADPRKQFLHNRAIFDLAQGYKLQTLKPGEQLVWHSPYAEQEAQRYGENFIKQCGFNSERKMGFIYRAYCEADGVVTLQSQTVDRNDPQAFKAVEASAAFDPSADLDTLVRIYDGTLAQKYGGHFYAGRRQSEVNENAWHEVTRHRDLIEHYFKKIEDLAASNITRSSLEYAATKARYAFWAALVTRINTKHQGVSPGYSYARGLDHIQHLQLEQEQQQAFNTFVAQGRVLSGCGGEIRLLRGEDNIMSASAEDVFSALFGNKKEGYSFDKKMYCVVCQAPPKEKQEKKKWCGPCGICKLCDTKIQAKNSYSLAA